MIARVTRALPAVRFASDGKTTVKTFISGQISGRPSIEALEQVIAEASQRFRGFPDESRGIAEAAMALLEDPKHERLMLLPRSPNDAEALWGTTGSASRGR